MHERTLSYSFSASASKLIHTQLNAWNDHVILGILDRKKERSHCSASPDTHRFMCLHRVHVYAWLMAYGIIFHGHLWNKWQKLVVFIAILWFCSTCITHIICITRFDFIILLEKAKYKALQIWPENAVRASHMYNLLTHMAKLQAFTGCASFRQPLPVSRHALSETWWLAAFITT